MFALVRSGLTKAESPTKYLSLYSPWFAFGPIYDRTTATIPSQTGEVDTVMPLTDTRIRNAKPTRKAYKLSDGSGMYLLITSDGARYWRMDYRFHGKRRTLALGVYPIVTLAAARARREDARALLAKDIDPSAEKKATKRTAKLATENTFEAMDYIGRFAKLRAQLEKPSSSDGYRWFVIRGSTFKQIVGETPCTSSCKRSSQSLNITKYDDGPPSCYGTRSSLRTFHSTRAQTLLAPLFGARVEAWTPRRSANGRVI
jgi:hypothetical protein